MHCVALMLLLNIQYPKKYCFCQNVKPKKNPLEYAPCLTPSLKYVSGATGKPDLMKTALYWHIKALL